MMELVVIAIYLLLTFLITNTWDFIDNVEYTQNNNVSLRGNITHKINTTLEKEKEKEKELEKKLESEKKQTYLRYNISYLENLND
jgi:hypothetical protein